MAEGINSMTPSLSGTHAFNDQEIPLLPKLNVPKRTIAAPGKKGAARKIHMADNYPKENAAFS